MPLFSFPPLFSPSLPPTFSLHSYPKRKRKRKITACRDPGKVIEDERAGNITCTGCGLVLEKQFLSEQTEWRSFAENDRSGPDPNRVGRAQHYLQADVEDFSTSIMGDPKKSRFGPSKLLQKQREVAVLSLFVFFLFLFCRNEYCAFA